MRAGLRRYGRAYAGVARFLRLIRLPRDIELELEDYGGAGIRSVGRVPNHLQIRLQLRRRRQLQDVTSFDDVFVLVHDGSGTGRRLAPNKADAGGIVLSPRE